MADQQRIEIHEILEERGTLRSSFGHSFGGTIGQGLGCIVLVIIVIVLLVGGTLGLGMWLGLTDRHRKSDGSSGAKTSAIAEARDAGPVAAVKPVEKPKPSPPVAKSFAVQSSELAAALIDAAPDRRKQLLVAYRDAKGPEYSEALAQAAAKANGEAQIQFREALVLRLTRMTVATLKVFLRDTNAEVRRAAALASGPKGDKSLIHDLIRMLAEDDSAIVQASRSSLKTISGTDHGPELGASPSERLRSVLAWREWEQGQPR